MANYGRWTDCFLDTKRMKGDPVADAVVAKLFTTGSLERASHLFERFARSDDPIPAALPDSVEAYFHVTDALPARLDKAQIARGQVVFEEYGPFVAAALFCSSLPQSYCAFRGARVLLESGRLSSQKRIDRRILETAQLVFDVLDTGGFEADGRAIRTCQKVRLMHAAIRHMILSESRDPWDVAALGTPINQEDLAGTLMAFSVVVLDALEAFGLPLTSAQREDFYAVWRLAAHFLGLDDDVVPRDVADAHDLMTAIRARQFGKSPAGHRLSVSLIDAMRRNVPGTLFDGLPVAMMWHLLPADCTRHLGLEPAGRLRHYIALQAALFRTVSKFVTVPPIVHRTVGWAIVETMKGICAEKRHFKDVSFRLPKQLERRWGFRSGR